MSHELDINATLQAILEHMTLFEDVIESLQNQINEIKFLVLISVTIFVLTLTSLTILMNDVSVTNSTKSEKHSDLFIFDKEQKDLCSFLTKLCLKL